MGNENEKIADKVDKNGFGEEEEDEDLDEVYDKIISKPYNYLKEKQGIKMHSYNIIIKNIPPHYICNEKERFKKLYRIKKNFTFEKNFIYDVKVLEKKIDGQQYIGKFIKKEEIEKIGLDNYLQILKSEMRSFSSISHPNTERLLKIYIYKEFESFTLIQVTNFTINYTLLDDINDRITKKKKYEEYEIKYVAQILTSISLNLRSNSIVHRNITPDNIFFTKKGSIRGIILKNYGLSIEIDRNGNCNGLYGPLWYLAPEILKGSRYDYKSDIWSIGIIIYMMTTLQNPFADCEKISEILRELKSPDFILPKDELIFKGNSPELTELIYNLLNENPILRISNEKILDLDFFKNTKSKYEPSYDVLFEFINYNRYLSEELRIILNESEVGNLFHLLIYHLINSISNFILDSHDILLGNEIFNFMDENMNGTLTFQEIEDKLKKVLNDKDLGNGKKSKNTEKIKNYVCCLKVILFDNPLVVQYHGKTSQLIDYQLFINANAILKLVKFANTNYPLKIVNILFDEIDLNKNNIVDIKEFQQFYSQSKNELFNNIVEICNKINEKGVNIDFNNLTREIVEKMITYQIIPLNYSQRNQLDTFKIKDEIFENNQNK